MINLYEEIPQIIDIFSSKSIDFGYNQFVWGFKKVVVKLFNL